MKSGLHSSFLISLVRLMIVLILGICISPAFTRDRLPIGPQQSQAAHRILDYVYSGNKEAAKNKLRELEKLESAKELPPISALIVLSAYSYWMHTASYSSQKELQQLKSEAQELATKALKKCEHILQRDPNNALYLLIQGGILGFLASLAVDESPLFALRQGYKSVKILERVLQIAPEITDAHLALGIFYCAVSNSPAFVRTALKAMGIRVSAGIGLKHLRMAAYHGQFSNVLAQIFLIRFLSPYVNELHREKTTIFIALERRYPGNAYFTFLRNDEDLAFHSEELFNNKRKFEIEKKIRRFNSVTISDRRFINLVKWQYSLFPTARTQAEMLPDIRNDHPLFRYYPTYVETLRFKYALEKEKKLLVEQDKLRLMQKRCLQLLDKSEMDNYKKSFFSWHLRDGLSMD